MENQASPDYLNTLDAMFAKSAYLKTLAKPLFKQFGLIDYCFHLMFANAEALHLTCSPQLDARLAEATLKRGERYSAINFLDYLPKQRYTLMAADPMDTYIHGEMINNLNDEFDYREDFVAIDQIQTRRGAAVRLVIFCSPLDGPDLNGFYLNNLELIERINNHFTRELMPIIETTALIKPSKQEVSTLQKNLQQLTTTNTESIAAFVADTGMNYPKYQQLAKVNLSEREKEIIHWYLRGKTTNQTAEILQLSHYTVRSYFETLKKKLGVYFKPQILLKLIDGEFISSDDWKDIY